MVLEIAPKGWEEKFPRQWTIAGLVALAVAVASFLLWLQSGREWTSTVAGISLVVAVGCFLRAFLYRVLARRP